MKTAKHLLAAAVTSALIASPSTFAEVYEVDEVHSQILFFVNHLGFSNSQGEFHDYDVDLDVDLEDWSKSSVNVVIRSASVDMDDTKWDDHLKNEDFLTVDKFPEMTFKSTKVSRTEGNSGKLEGDLTILGVTKPVTLDFTLNKAGQHPFSKKQGVGFSATGVVKRSEFGIDYAVPAVSDEVKLMIEIEAYQPKK